MLSDLHKVDAHVMSIINKKKILSLIRRHKRVSRADLAKETGLAIPTVSRILEELTERDKLVRTSGTGISSGGRRPNLVEFNHESLYIIGIDIGATHIRGILSDLDANILFEIQLVTAIEKGFDYIIDTVVRIIDKLRNRKGVTYSNIKGVGLGIAGLVNKHKGEVEFSPDFNWSNINLQKELESRIDLPFYFDNSSRLMALGELEFGKNSDCRNFAVLNLGYGIAAGLVVEGNLVSGDKGFAGEFGHISVDFNSKIRCHCGQQGCLEALASGNRIAALGTEVLNEKQSKILQKLYDQNGEIMEARIVALAAKAGDVDCLKIFDEVTTYLCLGIRNLVNILNPETIFLGGGVSSSGDFLFDLIRKKLATYLFKTNSKVTIVPCTFGEHATIMGAVSLVLHRIVNFEI